MKSSIFFFFILISLEAIGQISESVLPRSLGLNLGVSSTGRLKVKDLDLPSLDNEQEMARAKRIKDENCSDCPNRYFGRVINFSMDVKREGQKIELTDGHLWLLRVSSKSAKSLHFLFSEFYLPEGATLHIYSDKSELMLGAFTHRNINPDGKFMTSIFPEREAVFEYYEPKNASFPGRLVVDKISHGFRSIDSNDVSRDGSYGSGGSCTINVACSQADPVRNEVKAVAMISSIDDRTGLHGYCSGFLINSTDEPGSKRPYFMTAGHCLKSMSRPEGYYFDYVFYFNYQSSTCENQFNNPLSSAKAFQGAYLKSFANFEKHENGSDYALLELQDRPENYTQVSYLGWDRRFITHFGTLYNISHPNSDAKKIAVGADPTGSSNVRYSTCINYPLNVWQYSNTYGVSRPGSSGSPVLNINKRVIGVLHGGISRCADSPPDENACVPTGALGGPDFANRMDWIWDHPGQANESMGLPYSYLPVSYFLDATLTGQQFIDTYVPQAPPTGGGNPHTCQDRLEGDPNGVKISLEDDNQAFGWDVAASGDFFAVSALDEKTVYVYKREHCSVRLITKLYGDRTTGLFGHSLDMDGDVLVIGHPDDGYIGTVYFYERSGDSWLLVKKISSTDPKYGFAVAAKGNNVIVGSPGSGYLSFYNRDVNGWRQVNVVSDGSNLGLSVDITTNRAVAVAGGQEKTVKIIEYSPVENKWSIKAAFTNSKWLGKAAISTDGNLVIVAGSIINGEYSIKFHNGNWAIGNDQFPLSYDVSTNDDYLLFSTVFKTNFYKKDASGEYVYVGQVEKVEDRGYGDRYGQTAALAETFCVVGATENDEHSCNYSGSVYVYDLFDHIITDNVNVCELLPSVPNDLIANSISVGDASVPANCTVAYNYGDFNYQAVDHVVLKPGFWAKGGVSFKASIKGCQNFNNNYLNVGRMKTNGSPSPSLYKSLTDYQTKVDNQDKENSMVSVFPNPALDRNFKVQSFEEDILDVTMFNIHGQGSNITTTYIHNRLVEVEIHSQLSGIFLLKVRLKNKTSFSKKIQVD